MAATTTTTVAVATLAILLLALTPTLTTAEVVCESLPTDLCAYAISSSSKRCVLESTIPSSPSSGPVEYQCKTSEVVVERLSDWIETEDCVSSCGLDRSMTGISSDALLDVGFTSKLCGPRCYHNCPNVVDLYFNLAAGEGVFLPDLCQAGGLEPHRSMVQLLSSGASTAALSPESPSMSEDATASAPAPSPSV